MRGVPVIVAMGVALVVSAAAEATPRRVVGDGRPASCTSAAVVAAVARGGHVTFDCGPAPVTSRRTRTAKVRNTNPLLILDGGGRVTLDGVGRRRILYQNTCDRAQAWTTSHCQDQATPTLIIRGLALRGGRLIVQRSTFIANRCDLNGPDVGGAAIRVLDQYRDRPVQVSASVFRGGRCANGGALSSIGVSWVITGSRFIDNRATGRGANPARPGTPGGGNGGAVYLDGNRFTLTLRDSVIQDNVAPEGGGAVFFVSNDRTGTAALVRSTLRRNRSLGFETRGLPGIFFLGARRPSVVGSVLAR